MVAVMERTLYDVLMISPYADRQLMTAAYRHLAKRYHPDVDPSPEAASRMAELNEAYAILGDPSTRAAYDERLGLRPAPRPTGRQPRQAPGGGGVGQSGPVDAVPAGGRRAPQGTEGAFEPGFGEAGPPPANPPPSGPTLTFGRYRGWALNQVGRFDRDYLEWLSRTTMGRTYRRELDQLLRRR
jgi:DnaJ-class molecular chaperone